VRSRNRDDAPAFAARGALGRNRTCDTRFRKPLASEGAFEHSEPILRGASNRVTKQDGFRPATAHIRSRGNGGVPREGGFVVGVATLGSRRLRQLPPPDCRRQSTGDAYDPRMKGSIRLGRNAYFLLRLWTNSGQRQVRLTGHDVSLGSS
jgi:hypothetical protein